MTLHLVICFPRKRTFCYTTTPQLPCLKKKSTLLQSTLEFPKILFVAVWSLKFRIQSMFMHHCIWLPRLCSLRQFNPVPCLPLYMTRILCRILQNIPHLDSCDSFVLIRFRSFLAEWYVYLHPTSSHQEAVMSVVHWWF